MSKVLGILCCGLSLPALFIKNPAAVALAFGLLYVGNEFLRHDEWESARD